MVNVYLNPGKLNSKIHALSHFSEATKDTRAAIDGGFTHDPLKREGGMYALTAAISSAGDAVDNLAKEISSQKMTIERLNSNGIAASDSQGGINLEVPNDSDALEDSSKFQKWSQAALDASDLKKAEEARDVNKQNDIIQRIEQNKTDHTYASTFVDRYGVENVILLPGRAGSTEQGRSVENTLPDPKLTALSGSLLSYASQTWGSEKSKQMSDRIRGWLKESHTPGMEKLSW